MRKYEIYASYNIRKDYTILINIPDNISDKDAKKYAEERCQEIFPLEDIEYPKGITVSGPYEKYYDDTWEYIGITNGN